MQNYPQSSSLFEKAVRNGLRLFFHLLYHPMAGTYDMVAATVSVGRWNSWVSKAADLVDGPNVLELGFGPGHLQKKLLTNSYQAYGLDESNQMTRQAYRKLTRLELKPRLTRGLAQQLPYAPGFFDSIVSTFPTPYIIDPQTLAEAKRVLKPGGKLVVLTAAWITGKSFLDRCMTLLNQAAHQVPGDDVKLSDFTIPFTEAGFNSGMRFFDLPGSRIMFIIAKK